jgi:glycosyltransferase involved in cell wall biosynthesis
LVINSRIGLDVIAKFGRGLSQSARLYCAYFSMGVQGLGVPYGTRYPHRTLPYSAALTDNSEMVDCLRRLWDGITGPGIIELPPKIEVADDQLFQHRLESRTRRACKLSRQIRWLWISRVEVFKGTTILAEIARKRANDQFDVFGPISGSLADLGLTSTNLRHCGILSAISVADFTDYDGFLFTSLFEGMPNIVLEMSQHAIPMVLADVGGLRGTFGDDSVRFVKHADTVEESATSYLAELDSVARMTVNEVSAMVKAARVQVLQRHSPEVYKENVSRIFVHGNPHV